MARKFWFIPSNSSQVSKFEPVMAALRSRGADVRFLCVDAAIPAKYAARPRVERSEYPFELLPESAFDPRVHWSRQILQRPHLERAFRSLLDRIDAHALIFGADTWVSGRLFVRVARRRAIPTVLMVDGLDVPPNPRFTQGPGPRLRSLISRCLWRILDAGGPRGTSGVDGILVISAMGKETLVRQGVAAGRIHVVGSPEYDRLAVELRKPVADGWSERLRKQVGLPAARPIVFFAHQELDGHEHDFVRTMVKGARRAGAVLLVKFHPRGNERADEWRGWAAQEGIGQHEAIFVHEECSSIEAVRLCSVCVTAYSTVTLEAFVIRRPVILVQYANVRYALPYGKRYGAVIDAHSPKELEESIAAVLTDETIRSGLLSHAQKAIAEELCGVDGSSAARSVRAIEETIDRVTREARGARPSTSER